MLSVICFSKDRPMQVDAYIQSLMFCSGLAPEHISILYAQSEGISYDRAISRHPGVNWVREVDFKADLAALVATTERYILFGCDDVIFHGAFDPSVGIAALERDPELFGFSLRLGLNLHSLPDLREQNGVLGWSWRAAPQGHWSYPWDVSASIYRREFVAALLDRFEGMTNPNRLESYYAEALAAGTSDGPPRLAAFASSKSVTLTINRVQDEYPNAFDGTDETSPEYLYQAYAAGREIDWPALYGRKFRRIHIDSRSFGLTDEAVPPAIETSHVPGGKGDAGGTGRSLAGRILVWRVMNHLKEGIRRFIPRPVLSALRKLLRA